MFISKSEVLLEMLEDFNLVDEEDFGYFVDEDGSEFLVDPSSDVFLFDGEKLHEVDIAGYAQKALSKAKEYGAAAKGAGASAAQKAGEVGSHVAKKAGEYGAAAKGAGQHVASKAGEYASKAGELSKSVGIHPGVAAGVAGAALAGGAAAAALKRRSTLKKAGVLGKGGLKSQYKSGGINKAQYKTAKKAAVAAYKGRK